MAVTATRRAYVAALPYRSDRARRIAFSVAVLPVPAHPVRNTLRPSRTASIARCCCSDGRKGFSCAAGSGNVAALPGFLLRLFKRSQGRLLPLLLLLSMLLLLLLSAASTAVLTALGPTRGGLGRGDETRTKARSCAPTGCNRMESGFRHARRWHCVGAADTPACFCIAPEPALECPSVAD
jgi:hypothetical protein